MQLIVASYTHCRVASSSSQIMHPMPSNISSIPSSKDCQYMMASKIRINHPQVCKGDQSKIQVSIHQQAANVNTKSCTLASYDTNQATSIKVKENELVHHAAMKENIVINYKAKTNSHPVYCGAMLHCELAHYQLLKVVNDQSFNFDPKSIPTLVQPIGTKPQKSLQKRHRKSIPAPLNMPTFLFCHQFWREKYLHRAVSSSKSSTKLKTSN